MKLFEQTTIRLCLVFAHRFDRSSFVINYFMFLIMFQTKSFLFHFIHSIPALAAYMQLEAPAVALLTLYELPIYLLFGVVNVHFAFFFLNVVILKGNFRYNRSLDQVIISSYIRSRCPKALQSAYLSFFPF